MFDLFAPVLMDYFRGVLGISVVFIKDYLRLLISYLGGQVLFWRILGLCFGREFEDSIVEPLSLQLSWYFLIINSSLILLN